MTYLRPLFTIFWKLKNYVLPALLLLSLYVILYKIYIPRVNAFGCFDDCYNIVAGYFITKGKTLYSEIPFNHQMLMAYISYIIQQITHPINIYELILRHRQFVLLFGLLMNLLLVIRFRFAALSFVLFYELTKFYIFGDRFLAEGIIVYPLVYLCGILWDKLHQKKLSAFELIIAAILTWFIIFMREPYTLAALLLFISIILRRPFLGKEKYSLSLFLLLVLLTAFSTPINTYIYNLVTVNYNGVLQQELKSGQIFGSGLIRIFLYPLAIIIEGTWNDYRIFQIGLSAVFCSLVSFFILKKKKLSVVLLFLVVMGFTNIRFVTPGNIYYASFHMIPWFGMFIFLLFLFLGEIYRKFKKAYILLLLFLYLLLANFLLSSNSYLREQPDTHRDLLVNYGPILQAGGTVKALSSENDTFFVDGFDELLHWQADRPSGYKYNWYTSYMPQIPRYAKARMQMFAEKPPDFYYGSCPKEQVQFRLLPEKTKNLYLQLYSDNRPTCLYVKKTKIPEITKAQWQKAKELLYELPIDEYNQL